MHNFIERLARFFAVLGGLVLTFLIVMTCLSIAGRSINSVLNSDFLQGTIPSIANALLATGLGPINGDFELVEAGLAFAIFAFIPLCQLEGAHASVDIFTSRLPARINQKIQLIIEIAFAAALVLIAVKLFEGTQSKRNSGETTLLLQYPLWWAYGLSLLGAIIAALISVYLAVIRLVETITGKHTLPLNGRAEH